MKRKLIKMIFGIKTISAWAIVGSDGFLLVQNRPEMECQVYMDSNGKTALRENLKIVPCEVVL